ncbi:MAG: OmpH family outer membrane protein [Melioribacteraceae bacterium]|nr:OmpH family outer membrane protein [Melioribacteraceae bacterium]WKZ68554.1 MAG: OmpH family outer membrane protein [Melioribacteraceae bacterium]
MKKVFLFSIVLLFMTVALTAQTTGLKVGFVDSQVILNQYPPAIKAQSDLDAMIQNWNKKIDSMTVALQQAYQTYQQQIESMTPEARATREQEIVGQQQKLDQFRQSKYNQQNGELYIKQEEMLGPIKQNVFDAIDKVAKEEGMNFVFDKAGDVVLLYADQEFDITFKVLDKLKRGK